MTKVLEKITAFTLAEVLITLSIIGVVASMTIPALMNNSQNQANITAWKKAYSGFSQAFLQLLSTNDINWTNRYTMRDSFLPYFKTVQTCDNAGDDCWHTAGKIKTLSLSDGTQYSASDYSTASGFITADGMKVIFFLDNSNQGWIMVDVNGDKLPNTLGKDIFGLRVFINLGKAIPFEEAEMGTCDPVAAGAAGNGFIGLGCSKYYLYN